MAAVNLSFELVALQLCNTEIQVFSEEGNNSHPQYLLCFIKVKIHSSGWPSLHGEWSWCVGLVEVQTKLNLAQC